MTDAPGSARRASARPFSPLVPTSDKKSPPRGRGPQCNAPHWIRRVVQDNASFPRLPGREAQRESPPRRLRPGQGAGERLPSGVAIGDLAEAAEESAPGGAVLVLELAGAAQEPGGRGQGVRGIGDC